jgi:hypothetical protein
MGRREDEEGLISGGRFTPAANLVLPPVRNFQIQGGRFVPAAETILPPVRNVEIQAPNRKIAIDYDEAYHFGSIAILPGSSYWKDAWVEYLSGNTWVRGTSIPAGAQIKIYADFSASITDGNDASIWGVGVTVIDTIQGQLKNWGLASGLFAGKEIHGPIELNRLGNMIMPNYNIQLRFQMWGNDDSTPPEPDASMY